MCGTAVWLRARRSSLFFARCFLIRRSPVALASVNPLPRELADAARTQLSFPWKEFGGRGHIGKERCAGARLIRMMECCCLERRGSDRCGGVVRVRLGQDQVLEEG